MAGIGQLHARAGARITADHQSPVREHREKEEFFTFWPEDEPIVPWSNIRRCCTLIRMIRMRRIGVCLHFFHRQRVVSGKRKTALTISLSWGVKTAQKLLKELGALPMSRRGCKVDAVCYCTEKCLRKYLASLALRTACNAVAGGI